MNQVFDTIVMNQAFNTLQCVYTRDTRAATQYKYWKYITELQSVWDIEMAFW